MDSLDAIKKALTTMSDMLTSVVDTLVSIGEAILGFFEDLATVAKTLYTMTAELGGAFGVLLPASIVSALLLFVTIGILYKIVGR